MKRVKLPAIILTIILFATIIFATCVSADCDSSSYIDRYVEAYEGQLLSIPLHYGQCGYSPIDINSDWYATMARPVSVNATNDSQVGLPPGSTMPYAHVTYGIANTSFDWTPTYCQAITPNYTYYNTSSNTTRKYSYHYRELYWTDGGFPYQYPHHIIARKIIVYNVNRPPIFMSQPVNQTIAAGAPVHLDITATDPDMTECSDDNITLNKTSAKGTFVDNGYGNGDFDWTPSLADVGMQTVSFRVKDINGSFQDMQVRLYVINTASKDYYPVAVNENSYLSFTDQQESLFPYEQLVLNPTNLPNGATMPYQTGTTHIESLFGWTPNYCQFGTYNVVVHHSIGSINAGDSNYHLTVNNLNRQPEFMTLPSVINIKSGSILKLNVNATDPDMTQCYDDNLTMSFNSDSPISANFSYLGDGKATLDWEPQFSNIGKYNINFSAMDSHNAIATIQTQLQVYLCGDANNDKKVNVADTVYLINFIFKNGPAPVILNAADTNGDGSINVADAVYLINYIFKNGPAPVCK
jgi:hypothetical protein